MSEKLTVFFADPVLERIETRKENVLSGDPTVVIEKFFNHPSGNMTAGTWECQVGKFVLPPHPSDEFCVFLEGEAVIEYENGDSKTIKAGDGFIIPKNLVSTWDIKKKVKKMFVMVYNL